MLSQLALKHVYLPVLAAAALGGVISVGGSVLTTRNLVTTEELDNKLKPINATLARHEKILDNHGKLLEKTATKAEMNEILQLLHKKTRCPPW
jgi:hypothetical protein